MGRKKMAVLRSYRDAAKMLATTSKEAAYEYLIAVLDYGLDDIQAELSGPAGAMFLLTKPNLDTSLKMSDGGAKGGATSKPTESLPETLPKPTESLLEQEIGDRSKEIGERKNTPHKPPKGAGFEEFWAAYPKKVAKKSAKKAFESVKVPLETLLAALERQKCSEQWSKDGGQYIPNPATWLNQGRWEDELPQRKSGSAAGYAPGSRQLDPEEQAAIQRMLEG